MYPRIWIVAPALAACLAAQDSSRKTSVSAVDINGRRIDSASYSSSASSSGSQRVETTRSINGRTVPVETAEDRVLRQDSTGRVVERTVRRYDPAGGTGLTDTIRIEERINPDGSKTTQATTYRSDLNGNRQVFERVTTDARKGAASAETTTTVERPNINGGLQLFERSQAVERASGSGAQTEATTYRRDISGNLIPTAREVKVLEKAGNVEKSDAARYEVGTSGKMELTVRTIGSVKTNPDGSQIENVDVYGRQMATNAGDTDAAQPRLQQQIVKQRSAPGPGNVVVESTSVRARLPNDPSRFTNYEEVTKVTRTSTDASGREVKDIETAVGRRDPNGRVITQDIVREQSVEKKAAPAK